MTTVLESLNKALNQALSDDPRVYLLGEDLLDPYGGAFKVTRGLSSTYPERVIPTPVSEAGIVGVATGMAMRGLLPVVEIMFGDFVTLIADQLINHLSKFRWMYNEQVRVPVVIRTPMGGRRGYGPTHSQTLEKLFLGAPGLKVLAPAPFGDPGELLYEAILGEEDPILFIENKLLYLCSLHNPHNLAELDFRAYPDTRSGKSASPRPRTYSLSVRGAPPPNLTLTTYGHMAELAHQAVIQLAYEYEIFVELIIFTQLSPFAIEPVLHSVSQTGRILVAEEGTLSMGWGAEIVARTSQELGPRLKSAWRIAARDLPVPASASLEAAVLPGVQEIVHRVRKMV